MAHLQGMSFSNINVEKKDQLPKQEISEKEFDKKDFDFSPEYKQIRNEKMKIDWDPDKYLKFAMNEFIRIEAQHEEFFGKD